MLIVLSGSKFGGAEIAAKILVDKFKFQQLLVEDFADDQELLDYATVHYTIKIVLLCDRLELAEKLNKRPFFVHLSFDAAIGTRVQMQKCFYGDELSDETELSALIQKLDVSDYNVDSIRLRELSQLRFRIVTQDIDELERKITDSLDEQLKTLGNSDGKISPPLRPDWDTYFMKLATLAASRSNCMKRRVGCVIVRDARVIATGYNGTPRHLTNCFNGGCPRCNNASSHSLHTCLCLHAEENALLEAGRDRVGKNAILYCDTCPCLTCSVKIVQTGITEVVYSQSYRMDEDSFKVLKEGGVKVRQFNFVKEPRLIFI